MILTPDNIEALTTEELSDIVWEMYKSIHGIRPRFMTTREEYLSFLKYELQPEMIAQREQEWADEEAYYKTIEADEEREQLSLDLEAVGYPGEQYENLDIP